MGRYGSKLQCTISSHTCFTCIREVCTLLLNIVRWEFITSAGVVWIKPNHQIRHHPNQSLDMSYVILHSIPSVASVCIHSFNLSPVSNAKWLQLWLFNKLVSTLASLYLKYRLPVSMDVHDTFGPLHHALSTWYFDTLMFEAANTELAWFIPPYCRRWSCALHGCLPPVLEPHYCPVCKYTFTA